MGRRLVVRLVTRPGGRLKRLWLSGVWVLRLLISLRRIGGIAVSLWSGRPIAGRLLIARPLNGWLKRQRCIGRRHENHHPARLAFPHLAGHFVADLKTL